MTTITVHLFQKPEFEFGPATVAEADKIRAKGTELKSRLDRVAELVERFTDMGWSAEVQIYDVGLHTSMDRTDARNAVARMGLPQELESMLSWDEDEEEVEDDMEFGRDDYDDELV